MATIVVGTYMFRYPLGGNLSWALQYLSGLKELGHKVYAVEKFVYPDSCYDPEKQIQSNNCSYGIKTVLELLKRYGLENCWCFVENPDIYHGLSKKQIEKIFREADLYIENGAHGAWDTEANLAKNRVFIDVDPAFTQIMFYKDQMRKYPLPEYDSYYTNGLNVGKPGNIIPTNGIQWKYIFNPVNLSLFNTSTPPPNAPYSTIMNWKSYEDVDYKGIKYGHKDTEFDKFIQLPQIVSIPMEIAVSGLEGPMLEKVITSGWTIKNAQEITFSFNSFRNYLANCRGEFSVCKNMYTATNSGWFSDKSAAFMASGRPVVVQETGFSSFLPTGEGLFAVSNVEEARTALEKIESNYHWHCKKAREIASECLEAKKILKSILSDFNLS